METRFQNIFNKATNERPYHVAILVFLIYGALTFVKLYIHRWDPTVFIVAGDYFTNASQLVSPISILKDSVGYDGQFYYRLSLDPFTSLQNDFGISIDNPPFRMQRILYPLIVWLLSFGKAPTVPWMMIAVNLGGLCLIGYLGAKIAQTLSLTPCVGGLIAAYPGFFVTLNRDTTEIVATACGLLALYLAIKKLNWWAIFFACIAVLARETTLLYLSGFGLVSLLNACKVRSYISISWVRYLLPVAIFLVWQKYLSLLWGTPPHSGGLQDLGVPFAGIGKLLLTNLTESGLYSQRLFTDLAHRGYNFSMAILLIYIAWLVARSLFNQTTQLPLKITWALYATLMACLSNVIWLTSGEYLRAFAECYVVGMVLLLGAPRHIMRKASIAVAIAWVPTGILFIR